MTHTPENKGPLRDIRIFDMTRILAGPTATQGLGDLGADVIKIEQPKRGDDTRTWGPPFLKDKDGHDTHESAYYLSANKNKKSLTLDYTTTSGQDIAKKLIVTCDILVENYKPGTLNKYGLSYQQLQKDNPNLIYCSITGFGQDGPYKNRAGYDFMIQGMGGIMSLTGEKDGAPYKTGLAITDLMTGMYTQSAILAALYHRAQTGEGQFIDISMLDTQVAWLSYAAQYYLTSGTMPPRMGNAHPTIVPYEAFKATDGHIILTIGNDQQFTRFCQFAEQPDIAKDPQFSTNPARVKNRDILIPMIYNIISQKSKSYWIEGLEKCGVPCGPINNLQQVFDHPQVQARAMTVTTKHPLSPNDITLISNPLKFSATPTSLRHAPPVLGADTEEILKTILSLTDDDIQTLKEQGTI